jgi:glycosyltransferase involved in cell wall biosynthesis
MRIVHLTAGTGNFHCGTCLRDHALVKALNQLGHDVSMCPLYLPFVLDAPDKHAEGTILLGGISVYLQQVSRFFRRRQPKVTRWLDSPGLLRFVARYAGMTRAVSLGRITYSLLQGESGRQAQECQRLVEHLQQGPRPDIICISNALLIGVAPQIRSALNVPVVCSLQGEDTFLDALPQPWRDKCWEELALRAADVDAFVAVSDYHRTLMQTRLKLPLCKSHFVHNGIDLTGFTPAEAPPQPPAVGYLARMCHAKGLHTLVDAFIILKQRGSIEGLKLRIAGAVTLIDKPYVRKLRARLQSHGLLDDVSIEPNIDLQRKQAFLRSLSVLSVPATYGESFGLYVLEALASGVPVVQPDHAVFGELLALTGGGILSRPDDAEHLAQTIEQLLSDEPRRYELAQRGRANVIEHFNMQRMARQVAAILEQCINHP